MKSTHESQGGELVEITTEECFELLGSQPVGRLAVPVPGQGPLVVPVNYRLDGDAIVFRSDPGLKLQLLLASPVSFQVDWIDWQHREGWTVLVRGTAYEASHAESDQIDLRPWAAGEKRFWIRIVPSFVTGRRLAPSDLEWSADERGYM